MADGSTCILAIPGGIGIKLTLPHGVEKTQLTPPPSPKNNSSTTKQCFQVVRSSSRQGRATRRLIVIRTMTRTISCSSSWHVYFQDIYIHTHTIYLYEAYAHDELVVSKPPPPSASWAPHAPTDPHELGPTPLPAGPPIYRPVARVPPSPILSELGFHRRCRDPPPHHHGSCCTATSCHHRAGSSAEQLPPHRPHPRAIPHPHGRHCDTNASTSTLLS
jgi:hypothetical protein